MSTFLTRDTVLRLMNDVKQIIKNPLTDNGIYYIHEEEDILKGYALIIGPSDTPYFGGYYFFELNYPGDYPHSPPKVTYKTNGNNIRFNPNLYVCGKVCVSLLNTWSGEQWTSCQTISTVLLTLCSLLCKDPLYNEPGVSLNHPDVEKYNKIIEFSNINIAICDIINKKQGVYLPIFENFHPFIKEHFLKNYKKLQDFVLNKKTEYGNEKPIIITGFYGMRVIMDYDYIKEKLEQCYLSLA